MPVLTRTRRTFRNTAYVLAGIALLSGMYLLLPFGPDKASLYAELDTRRAEATALAVQVRPLRDLPTLLRKSETDIDHFYKGRLPGRFSRVTEEIGRLATKNGVRLEDVKYDAVDVAEVPNLQEIQVTATLSGNYANIVKFINAVERNELFFLVHRLELGDEQSGEVRLDVQIETYLRPRTPEDFRSEDKKGTGD
jgi:type IV pilus assembly protein PilO